MRWLIFLSRLAFICGFFFLLAFALLFFESTLDNPIVSTVIIIGYLMGGIIVPITCACYVALLVFRRTLKPVQTWIVIANFLFLCVFAFYLYYQYVNAPAPA